MKAIILARVSTEEQKEAGNSLPAQIERLKNYCQRKDFEIAKMFSFDESAYKTKRDDFDEALDYLKTHKEKIAICFDKVDRLSRNVFDKRVPLLYEKALNNEIELHFASEGLIINGNISAEKKFQFNINLGLAKYYSDAISDNVKRAYEQKLRNGEWIGKAPIGYINITKENGKKDIIPDPERAHLIKQLFEVYAQGNNSMETLAQRMEKEGLRNKNRKTLSKSMIEHILNNPFYYGVMETKGRQYPHKYQTLISHGLFEQARSVRLEWHKKPFQYAAKPFILRGLIKCASCGCTITPELKKGKYTYYSCTNSKGMHENRLWIREEELLKPIYKILDSIKYTNERIEKLTEGLKKINESKTAFHKKSIETLNLEYSKVQQRTDKLMDLLLDGSITKNEYDRKLAELKGRQYEISLDLEGYTKADEDFSVAASQVFSLAQRAREIFECSEIEEKRQLLNFLLQNCELNGKKLELTLRKPFDALVKYADCPTVLPG